MNINEYEKSIYEKLISWYHLSNNQANDLMKKYEKDMNFFYEHDYTDYNAAQSMIWNQKTYKNFREYKKLLKEAFIKRENCTKKELKEYMKYCTNSYLRHFYKINMHPDTLAFGIANSYL